LDLFLLFQGLYNNKQNTVTFTKLINFHK